MTNSSASHLQSAVLWPIGLLFVGRLVREKGIAELVSALASCPDAELEVVGSQLSSDRDGVQEAIRGMVTDSGLESRITFKGMLNRRDLMERMHSADVIVLPSHREGVPRSLIEGMAASRPAIATRIRGCRELVVDGVNGLLVPVEDVAMLAAAIRRVGDLTSPEFQEWSTCARSRMSANYRETLIFDRLHSAYLDLLSGTAS